MQIDRSFVLLEARIGRVECSRLAWCVGLFFLIVVRWLHRHVSEACLSRFLGWLSSFAALLCFLRVHWLGIGEHFFLCGLDNGSSDHSEIECYLGNYRTETPVRNTQHTHDTRLPRRKLQ